jgi:hypothetical protein
MTKHILPMHNDPDCHKLAYLRYLKKIEEVESKIRIQFRPILDRINKLSDY